MTDNWESRKSAILDAELEMAERGVKFDGNKLRMDLLPPELLLGVADVLTHGANKYGGRNWELGMDWSRVSGALLRHFVAWMGGEDIDPESGKPHLSHVACNIAFLIAYAERNIGNDDRQT